MLLLIIGLTLLIISSLIITPVIWCALGKIFRIEGLTFKKALLTFLLLALIGLAFQAIPLGLTFLKINNVVIDLIISIASLVVIISMLKIRFNTTVLKSICLYVLTIVFAVCLALLIRTYGVQAFKIPSGAMQPTILVGDHVLVNKFTYGLKEPQKGDIIVFKYPMDTRKDFIKRVVAVGGDSIESREKQIFVNGKPVIENYLFNQGDKISSEMFHKRDNFGPISVPEKSYFVMGDNRDNSHDSRFWGFVDHKNVKGKAFVIYWSWDEAYRQVRWDRIGNPL